MLRVRGLTKRYGGARPRTVFSGIDLDLTGGEYIAIMGESGSGKSTLLNLVAGLVEITRLDDEALTVLRRERMGFVFQAFHVLPYLSVAQNVALPLSLCGVDREDARQRVHSTLSDVGLAERATSSPSELSGGEMQRVAIARALVHAPRLVLADEPTGNLDAESASQVLALLRHQVKTHGASGILVTHSRIAAATCDRTLILTQDGLRETERFE